MQKKVQSKTTKKENSKGRLREIAIMEGALKVFGEKGYEDTTISAICKAAGISEATLYEYFKSKEEVLFSIPKLYTEQELEHMMEISRYIHGARERMRFAIQSYLEFYESNRLYTSVVMLTLKGNRNFMKSDYYQIVRDSMRPIIDVYNEGVEEGVFREDLDPYIVRNMVLGFIEHLTTQWLMLGRPETIADQRDTIFDMVIRAIEKEKRTTGIEFTVKVDGTDVQIEKN